MLALIALGGAVGAVMRFTLSSAAAALFGRGFPYGTLLVNVLGSCVIGALYVLLTERVVGGAGWRAFAVVGLLGALTTFSTFSMETLLMLEAGHLGRAAANVLLNVSLCLVACWCGLVLVRQL
ncbi:MAG: fluoride efflux transporter CrcB [Gammaproteobacteria bacterium]|nr:fluoride efflux transporter CrcB [Gammaproteobacteria bacterium]MCP5202472.1 fluoride efflux transporter CrcB [Gammaproteobacteria bacterium]